MRRASIAKSQERIQELSWELMFVSLTETHAADPTARSDDSRQICEGYCIIFMARWDEGNRELLEHDPRSASWTDQCVVDVGVATFIEYAAKDRDGYGEMWRRWICGGSIHEVARFFATGWPVDGRRIDATDDEELAWFEDTLL